MSKTEKNLKDAFAGESQANRKYLAFAQKADAEGYPQAARLFRAAAAAETVHAHTHLRTLKGVKSTLENLKEALGGKTYEFQSMYPQFVAEAQTEKKQAALVTFRNAMAVEKIHHALCQQALAAFKAGNDMPAGKIHVCQICGNTIVGEAPDQCTICGAPKAQFVEVK